MPLRGSLRPTLPKCPGTGCWIAQKPRVEPNVTGKKKDNEKILNDILVFAKIVALPSCHQPGFPRQLVGADAKTYNQTLG